MINDPDAGSGGAGRGAAASGTGGDAAGSSGKEESAGRGGSGGRGAPGDEGGSVGSGGESGTSGSGGSSGRSNASAAGGTSGANSSGSSGEGGTTAQGAAGQAGEPSAPTCKPTNRRCNNGTPQLCSASGAWADDGAKCSTTCIESTGRCAECTPTSKMCFDDAVKTCGDDGQWGDASACAAPQTCQNGDCACPGSLPNLCNGDCTNTQTDNFNCGRCGHSCQGGKCSAGVCQPLQLFAMDKTTNIAVAGSKVFWTTGDSFVYGISTLGAPNQSFSISFGGCVMGLAVDSGYVYSLVRDNCADVLAGAVLKRAALSGETTATAVSDSSGGYPKEAWRCLAVGDTNAFFTNFDTGFVHTVPKAGGTTTKLVQSIVIGGGSPKGISVQGETVYWADGGLRSAPATGGAAMRLTDSGSEGYVAADSTHIYYVDGGALMRMPATGGTPVTLSGTGATGPLAVDGKNVYYVGASSVFLLPKSGGTPTTLASGQSSPVDIAVDDTSVYWLTSNAIMKCAY